MNCHEVIGFIYKSPGSTCPPTMSNVENSHPFECRPFLADGDQSRLHPDCKLITIHQAPAPLQT
ncbi:hypothetical protein K0M31_005124 [Melipona bicolor]|uniref:Uncharacterized protein n=1 Tax=Melipona bicolor TaxID=60889 RepID=A0AA40KN64_9HYME|nr:hypothetical protein K0M31_005124 [Melipona bicolor]